MLAGAVLSGAGAMLLPATAAADTITVNSNSGAGNDGVCGSAPGTCTLADAVAAANSAAFPGPDEVTFDSIVTGAIELNSNLATVTEELAVTGPGRNALAVDARGTRRIFAVSGATELAIDGLTLTGGNGGDRGGAIDAPEGTVEVTDSVFSYNYVSSPTSATGDRAKGGAIHAASLTISGSSFYGNTAAVGDDKLTRGGAVSTNSFEPGSLAIGSSTFSNNHVVGSTGATAYGGAVFSSRAFTITNSTFSGNSAEAGARGGGGALGLSIGSGEIRGSTIADNVASHYGGGIFSDAARIYLSNTIVADNSAGATGNDLYGPANAGYSLVEDPAGATITGTTNITGQDPGLGSLADNGGPTLTKAITSSSPAFGTGGGTTLPTDQRGVLRPQGGAFDIGSFELDLAPAVRIDSAPSGTTSDSTPEIRFSSPDPDIARFECSVDGGAFATCASPFITPTLEDGPHTVDVRAIDLAAKTSAPARASFTVDAPDGGGGGGGPSPDTEITDADVTAKKKQPQKGKKIKVKVKAGAGERVDLVAKGRITRKRGGKKRPGAAAKSFKLGKVKKSTEAGEQTVLRLKPKRRKDNRRIFRLLRRGKDLRANPSVKLTDDAGNSVVEKRVVRLKARKR